MGRSIDPHDAFTIQQGIFPQKIFDHGIFPIHIVLGTVIPLTLFDILPGQLRLLGIRKVLTGQIVQIAPPGALVLVAHVRPMKDRFRAGFLDLPVKAADVGAVGRGSIPVGIHLHQNFIVFCLYPLVQILRRIVRQFHKQMPHPVCIILLPKPEFFFQNLLHGMGLAVEINLTAG